MGRTCDDFNTIQINKIFDFDTCSIESENTMNDEQAEMEIMEKNARDFLTGTPVNALSSSGPTTSAGFGNEKRDFNVIAL